MTMARWFNPPMGEKPPVLLHWRASKKYILFVVAFAVFTVRGKGASYYPRVVLISTRICFYMEW